MKYAKTQGLLRDDFEYYTSDMFHTLRVAKALSGQIQAGEVLIAKCAVSE